MARSTSPNSAEKPTRSLRDIPDAPSASEWVVAITSACSELDTLPDDPTADSRRATLVLTLAHLRYRAPIQSIWNTLRSPDWRTGIAAVQQLPAPVRWAMAAASSAWFARNANEDGFEAACQLLKAFRFPPNKLEELGMGSVLLSIEHRPALLGELLQSGVLKDSKPLFYLARNRSPEMIAEVFRAVEEAQCGCDPEGPLGQAIWRTKRWNVALACLPLVKHDIVDARSLHRKTTAAERRDRIRGTAAECLAQDGQLERATELLFSFEDRKWGLRRAIQLLCKFAAPDRAYELWLESADYRSDWLESRDLALEFAKQGQVAKVLEVAAKFVGSKSERTDIVASALREAIEAGAVDAVAGALDLVTSKRERAKLEQLLARAGGNLEPKEVRAKAESLAMRASTPGLAASAATQLATILPRVKAPESLFVRAALVRMLAKADLLEAVPEHLSAAIAGVIGVSRKKVRLEAAAAVFAAAVSAERIAEGLAMLEACSEKLADHDEIGDFLFDVVETCTRAGIVEQLKKALPTGSEMWVVEQMEMIFQQQGVSEGKVEQLVAKAMKLPNADDRDRALWDIISDMEAWKQYPEALAVLRRIQEPHKPRSSGIFLARKAAKDGYPRVAEAILDVVEKASRPGVGGQSREQEAPWLRQERKEIREAAFEVRSAFELAGGDEDALVSVAEGMLGFSSPHLWEGIRDWIKTARISFGPDAKSRGVNPGRTLVESAGSLDAAIAREQQEDRRYVAPENLTGLARFAASEEALIARVPEVLTHALRFLQFTETSTSRHPHKEIADIAEFVMHGFEVPEFHAKAEELMTAIANGYIIRPAHQARVLAAMGRWSEAFTLLHPILPVSGHQLAPSEDDRVNVACHLLLTCPIAEIRAHASDFSEYIELAWVFTAALALRGGADKKTGLLHQIRTLGRNNTEFLQLIQESARMLKLATV